MIKLVLKDKIKYILLRVLIVLNVSMMAYTINDLAHVAELYAKYNELLKTLDCK